MGKGSNFHGVRAYRATYLVIFLLIGMLVLPQLVRGQAVGIVYSFGSNTSDASSPIGGVIQGSDGALYGAANESSSGSGAVYKIVPGTGAEVLLYNTTSQGNAIQSLASTLLQASNGNIYGVGQFGGANFSGGVFQIAANGQESTLHDFSGMNGDDSESAREFDNGLADFIAPLQGGLLQGSDGNFYGTASGSFGSDGDYGSVFRLTPGGQYTLIHSFGTANADGRTPESTPIEG